MKKAIVIGCGNLGFTAIKELVSSQYEVFAFDMKRPEYMDAYLKQTNNVHFATMVANDEVSVENAFSAFGECSNVCYVISTVGISNSSTPTKDPDGFDKVVDVNVIGNIIPIQYAVNHNIVSKGSRIVVICSTSGHFVWGGQISAYPTSKWILFNVCVSLQKELADKGIFLDVINPKTIVNKYSQSFRGKAGVKAEDVVKSILKVNPDTKSRNVYIPSFYRLFHFIERCIPAVFDYAFKQKPNCIRKRHYLKSYDRVLITGASSGLGKELALLFANECKTLYLVARRIEILNELKAEIENRTNCVVRPIQADLSDSGCCKDIINSIDGGVDMLINNAGVQFTGNVCSIPIAKFRTSIQTNCLSPIRLTGMLLNNGTTPKTIVNIISTTAIAGRKGLAAYTSAKAGLWSFSKSLRRGYGNQINVIDVIPATFKSSLGQRGSSTSVLEKPAKKRMLSSSNMGMTSESVAKIIHGGILKRKDIICVPNMKVKLFIWFEALFPGLFNRMFR